MQNILLVEDDKDISDYYTSSLQQTGFMVTTANNLVEALQIFRESCFDLVILDIVLNDDTEAGFKICKKIRSKSRDIPIIFLSSLDSDTCKISGMELDADDYITKDVSMEYLVVRIKALLHRTKILSSTKETKLSEELILGSLNINTETLTAKWKDTPVNLSLTQLWMVHALISSKIGIAINGYRSMDG